LKVTLTAIDISSKSSLNIEQFIAMNALTIWFQNQMKVVPTMPIEKHFGMWIGGSILRWHCF
jgi:hypothetical protein